MGYLVGSIVALGVLAYVLESLPRWLARRRYRRSGSRAVDYAGQRSASAFNADHERQRQMSAINADRRAAEKAMWRIVKRGWHG
jgi:hypothetical protein